MKIERYEKTVSVPAYIDGYVCVAEFLECCKACGNYNRKWCCPSFDFDPVRDYWEKFSFLRIIGLKMILSEEDKADWPHLMEQVKAQLTEELFDEEKKISGSRSLSAGSCQICGEDGCSRISGEPCRYPDRMRYSIEALGGNVGLTAQKLLGVQLQWIEDGKVPDYFVLVGGLLY